MILNVKYRFSKYPKIFMTNKGEMWQESYESANRCYGFRVLEPRIHLNQLKYRINRNWVSKKKLNECAYLVDEKIDNNQVLTKDLPF